MGREISTTVRSSILAQIVGHFEAVLRQAVAKLILSEGADRSIFQHELDLGHEGIFNHADSPETPAIHQAFELGSGQRFYSKSIAKMGSMGVQVAEGIRIFSEDQQKSWIGLVRVSTGFGSGNEILSVGFRSNQVEEV
jgi:hypothetical protein